ncbi:MAG: WecB/TagA/CpsF family glycosyltransferase [Deinococcota bacterium]|nr:WecB/TagA/CpsF family glycosyltransferase [Deinococcota bacterium]
MASIRFGTEIAGVQHGYFKRPDEVAEVVRAVAASKPDLLLAGLGEGQELFLHEYRHDLKVPVMIGVGGAIDVLAGEAKRTPSWTRRLGVEWAWRVGLDRKRWHRFPRLMAFVRLVRQEKRLNRQAKMMETR